MQINTFSFPGAINFKGCNAPRHAVKRDKEARLSDSLMTKKSNGNAK
jgi:hypothetical protein